MRELALGLLLAAAFNVAARRAWSVTPFALPERLSPEAAVETAGLLSFGMRRLAADIGLVRLLIYYGTAEKGQHHADDGHAHEHGEDFGGGVYSEIGPRARQILELDPAFSYPTLYASGALAFNLDRPEEALDLLTEAMRRNPGTHDFRAYIAAIGFHKKGDVKRVMEVIEPTLADSHCPTMIKHMMAFLYRRNGQREKALRLYEEIAETSRDEGYRQMARRALRELSGH